MIDGMWLWMKLSEDQSQRNEEIENLEMEFGCGRCGAAGITHQFINHSLAAFFGFAGLAPPSTKKTFFICWLEWAAGEGKKSIKSILFHSFKRMKIDWLTFLPWAWFIGAPLAERGCGRAAVFDFIKFNQILQLLPSLCCALSLLLLFDWIPLICFFALFASFRRSHWRCHRP